ncbi:MAG: HNH endonuclease [Thermomicrobiales bacterium]
MSLTRYHQELERIRQHPTRRFDPKGVVSMKSGGHCWYCGKQLQYRKRTLDHIVPRQHGGTNSLDNLVIACHRCNQAKGCMPLKQFRHVSPFGPTFFGERYAAEPDPEPEPAVSTVEWTLEAMIRANREELGLEGQS